MLPVVRATRYVTALREGGSLPGLVEADDDGMYLVKFRGGPGHRRLVAEVVVGELGRGLGIRVPDCSPAWSSSPTRNGAPAHRANGGEGRAGAVDRCHLIPENFVSS